jgi:hypothetical protein
VRLEGLGQMKNPMTSSGFEPAMLTVEYINLHSWRSTKGGRHVPEMGQVGNTHKIYDGQSKGKIKHRDFGQRRE